MSLLRTKLYIPPVRSKFVSRPRLIERLNAGMTRRLILVSAPAGFGKTTLMSEWVSQAKAPVAWVSLDEGDNDAARLLVYVVAALQTIEAKVGEGIVGALQSPQPPPTEWLLTALLNEATDISDNFALILDDYHVIKAPPIHEALAFLVEHMPSQMHLFIVGRADPPLPLPRLRIRGELAELRAADLRFTFDEAVAFFNEVMGLDLSAEHVAALETRTEGWAAGLQVAALALQGLMAQEVRSLQSRGDTVSFIQAFTGSHRYIMDYLVEEVLQRQPEAVQSFLLQTAVLDRLTGPLCNAVCSEGADGAEGGDGQAMLEALDRANLFVVPLDDERRWYRYHRLFADLLRTRLEQRLGEPGLRTLHRRASDWYERNGLIAEALDHALAARDFERAARLIEQVAWAMLTRGEMTTLLIWLDALPDELVRKRPWLCVFNAWALLFTGQLNAVEPRLRDVERHAGLDASSQAVLGHVAAIRAYVARLQGDVPRAVALSRSALERLPEDNLRLRGAITLNLGLAHWMAGHPVEAGRVMAESAAISQVAGDMYLTLVAISMLGQAQEMQGRLREAIETYRRAVQLTAGHGERPPPFAGLAYLGLAGPLCEWNDLDGAKRHVMTALELGERGGSVETLQGACSTLWRVRQAQGDVAGALHALQKAKQLAREHYPAAVPLVAASEARWSLAQGDLAAASRWAEESGLRADDNVSFQQEAEYLTFARVLTAQGKADEALQLLGRLYQAAQAAKRMGIVIEILTLQALALQAQGDLDRAVSALEQALSLAEPEGYVRLFVEEGEPAAMLLRAAASRGIAPDYVNRLLMAFGVPEYGHPYTSALVEPLSERELEVLHLVATGLSNREIADELIIALSTVKSHTNSIFGKLGVKSRTQAVAQARALGLL